MTQHHVPQGRSGAGEDAHLVARAQPDLGEDLETPELGEAPELGDPELGEAPDAHLPLAEIHLAPEGIASSPCLSQEHLQPLRARH